jgi:rhomboid protease GluP
METITAVLEARSQAQALDWSLVLISQGIESVITRREEDGVWQVEIAPEDSVRAQESIRAYERENAVPWRKELKGSGLLFDVRSVVWFAALALFYWLVTVSWPDVKVAGAMDRTAVASGEWWRLFTATTLHADVAHLAANVSIGIVFFGLAMGCFGAGNALLLSLLGGVLGNVATFVVHAGDRFVSLGASGTVMAALGLITAHSLAFGRYEKRTLLFGRGLMAGCFLVVLLGFSPKSDVVAHVGGFVGGLLLGAIAMGLRKYLLRTTVNFAAGLLFITLLLTTWWLALK